MDMREYLTGVAKQLIHEVEPVLDIKAVTANSDLLGSYTGITARTRLQSHAAFGMRAGEQAHPADAGARPLIRGVRKPW